MTVATADECFIAVYGTLRRHPWIDAETLGEDAYSLFNQYSEALKWSSSATYPQYSGDMPPDPRRSTETWGLSEAGGNWSDAVEFAADHILWVQTGLSKPTKQSGLPIAQLGLCAEKVLQRVGELTLSGVQMIIPVGFAPAPRPAWFKGILELSDPAAASVVRIEVDGGANDTCIRNAPQIVGELNEACERDGLRFTQVSQSRSSAYLLEEPAEMNRGAWLGRSVGRFETQVSVPEFSMDVSGYLMAHLARACHLSGVTSQVFVTILRG